MALAPDELARRIKAARVLRGIGQEALGRRFKADGLGEHDPGRIERGELAMRRVHLNAFMYHLRMPEWWFTTDNVRLADEQNGTVADRLDEALDAMSVELAATRAGSEPASPPAEEQGRSRTNGKKQGER